MIFFILNYKLWFAIGSVVFGIAAGVPYLYSIYIGKTKPPYSTYIGWSLIGITMVFLQLQSDHSSERLSLFMVSTFAILPLLSLVFMVRAHVPWILNGGKISLLGIATCWLIWVVLFIQQSESLLLASLIALAATDAFSTWPILLDALRGRQHSPLERTAWLMSALSALCGLATVSNFNSLELFIPAYLSVYMCSVAIASLLSSPDITKKEQEVTQHSSPINSSPETSIIDVSKHFFYQAESTPTFPLFKNLALSDMESIVKFTKNTMPYSDFNFTSMWSWNIIDGTQISKLHDNLIVKFTDYITNKPFYSFFGTENSDTVAKILLDYLKKLNEPLQLRLVPEVSVSQLNKKIFNVLEDRDNFDYVYSIEELSTYPGGHFAQKRKQMNGFIKRFPNVVVKNITLNDPDISANVMNLFDAWQKNKVKQGSDQESHDPLAMQRLLKNIDHFNLITVGIYISDVLSALFVCEKVDQDNILAHFMKADLSIDDGLYAFLMKKNAEILKNYDVTYFNYEQDLGIENLRIAKSRFQPKFFMKKYTVSYLNL